MKYIPWWAVSFLAVSVALIAAGVWLSRPEAVFLGFGSGVGVCAGFVTALEWARAIDTNIGLKGQADE